jgi:hypothetical protein
VGLEMSVLRGNFWGESFGGILGRLCGLTLPYKKPWGRFKVNPGSRICMAEEAPNFFQEQF